MPERSSRASRTTDRGAAAVEFALVLPLLMMFLFGIVQYGYGMFQLQALTATLDEATQRATTGISDCSLFGGTVAGLADGNGLDPDDVDRVQVSWLDDTGAASPVPNLLGQARVSVTFRPFRIGIPLLPFPDRITRTQTASMQNILVPDLGICDVRR